MSNEQIIKYIKNSYRTQKQLYFWSTFILPDGEFIIPENEEYDGDLYEHANIIAGVAENCFNDNWMDAEEWLENNCVKCNATFPYVGFPPNPTSKQYWATEEYINYINKEGNSFEGVLDYAEVETMQTPVQIIISRDSKIYDLAVYSADEIIDLVKKGRVSGMLSEATKVGVDEDKELNQVPDRKLDGQNRITFGDGNRERILAYLGLDSFSDLDELEGAIARAFEVEDEYLHQLKRGDFGYALTADFESIPHIIEDPADYKDLEEIESFGGITVYRKIKK